MFWAKIIVSLALIIFGAAASLWGVERLSERLVSGKYWLAVLFLAIIGALPELCIGLMANAKGMGIIAFGTPLGSSAINLLLLGGLAAAISPTKPFEPFPIKSAWGVAAAALLLMIIAFVGHWQSQLDVYSIPRLGGVLLLLAFALFIFVSYRAGRAVTDSNSDSPSVCAKLLWPLVFLVMGIVLVAGGAALASSAALSHIVATGASQNAVGIIGLALIAALPEVTAVIYLARQRQTASAFDDLLHSSATNLLFVIGIVALVDAVPAYSALPIDLGIILLGALLVLGAIALGKGKNVSRGEGIALMLFYLLFAFFVLLRQDGSANVIF